MFKLIKRFICLAIIAVVAFIVIAVLKGGEPFKWVGQKSEEAGKLIQEKSNELAERADEIQKTKEKLKEQTEKVRKIKKEITDR
ncbi:hypothetical protein MNBD_NITROSPIRAE03-1120 [hydrothermal vent metagenome]|uniref:Uncharacterized protein n=1 Tax=hydrothermal vent metagenome TaxID=652676 RepID=A0A3B1D6V8_9ZZZZ